MKRKLFVDIHNAFKHVNQYEVQVYNVFAFTSVHDCHIVAHQIL